MREAAEVLGASTGQYWRMVALPILFPSLLGTFALLFANSFGAVATAYALTGSSLSIVPTMLFAQIRGDVAGPASGLCHGLRDDPGDGAGEPCLRHHAHPWWNADAMKRILSWAAIVAGGLYFLLPLIGTVEFSLRMRRGEYSLDAYRSVLADPNFRDTFGYSIVMAL